MKLYDQMSLEERKKLFLLKKEGFSVKKIAQTLERHRSTVHRELNRNCKDEQMGYLPDTADNLAHARKAKHGLKLQRHLELKERVVMHLKDAWSPEVIAGIMKKNESAITISTEAIYQFIYSDEGKKLGLYRYLLKQRVRRGMIRSRKTRSLIPERVSIHDRPVAIEERDQIGHFEGDLTFFAQSKSVNVGVLVERKSRLVRLLLNTSKHANIVMRGMFNALAKFPVEARKSVTFDNGLEFVKHTSLRHFIGMDTYFCDKHAPWQKGQVEQMNVMIHRYIPKKSSLKSFTQEDINCIEQKLNNRPRKCLGFKTPAEVFNQELSRNFALRT